jgi:hypothetical protein
VGAATAVADGRDRAAAAAVSGPGVRAGGVPAHRNGGEPTRPEWAADPAVPREPIVDANPRPDPGDRFVAPASADAAPAAEAARERPAVPTVDLRGDDDLADPVRHDNDPSVPAGPVTAGEPGRP